jgi:hypothetical protein
VVVAFFFVSWAPFHAQRLIVLYVDGDLTKWTFSLMAVQNVMYFSSGIFYYVSSVINPILYNIMSLKFRQAFRSTMPQKARKPTDTVEATVFTSKRVAVTVTVTCTCTSRSEEPRHEL